MSGWDAILYFENGHYCEGIGFGATKSAGGEAVFNTGMTGYQEILTDPSYYKQLVVMTYPHLGNTGTNGEDLESLRVDLSGLIVRHHMAPASNFRSQWSLSDYLARYQVPGISEVDTREITQLLRDEGAQRAVIFPKKEADGAESLAAHGKALLAGVPAMEGLELVSKVSTKTPYDFEDSAKGKEGVICVYDYGVKFNTLRAFRDRGFCVKVLPYNFPHQDILTMKPKGVVLSNGPGDPAEVTGAVAEIQGLLGKVPVLAICMGHQLLARAMGASTYKLKFGHHGVNHPVKDLMTGRILITSQNHGFAVPENELASKDMRLSHINLNDGTVEGFVSDKMKFYSVQFHPEAAPGPNDAGYIFDSFIRGFVQ